MKTLTSISKHSDWLDSIDIVLLYKWNLHRRRVEFGKQPLAIYQFVPCKLVDGEWVVLEEPKNMADAILDGDKGKEWAEKRNEYKEALDKVLFEGFEIIDKGNFYFIERKETIIYLRVLKKNTKSTIENLLQFNNVPLTKTALKEIGL